MEIWYRYSVVMLHLSNHSGGRPWKFERIVKSGRSLHLFSSDVGTGYLQCLWKALSIIGSSGSSSERNCHHKSNTFYTRLPTAQQHIKLKSGHGRPCLAHPHPQTSPRATKDSHRLGRGCLESCPERWLRDNMEMLKEKWRRDDVNNAVKELVNEN